VKASYLLETSKAPAKDSTRTLYRAVSSDTYSLSGNGSSAGNGHTLTGRFAVFDRWTEINSAVEGHFMERIAPGAFTKTLKERGNNLPIMFSHGKDPQIGMMTLGRVRDISEEADGVRYAVDLFDGLPQLLVEGLKAGSYGASFRAKLVKDRFTQRPGRSEHNPSGIPESVVQELALREFGPTPIPQYLETSAEIRSLNDDFVPIRSVADLPPIHATSEPEKPVWFLERKPVWFLERPTPIGGVK
jgi:HK97 family phage prohead protease